MQSWTTKSEDETKAVAREIAAELVDGDIIFLSGTLGAGKSVIARAIIRTLLNDDNIEVPSPTFTLIQSYPWHDRLISHFDLYRLEDPEHIYETGWEDALTDGIALVEWPEKLGALKPRTYKSITIEVNGNMRDIHYKDTAS